MAYKHVKACLLLNKLLSEAWFEEVDGSSEVARRKLLEAKAALTNVLKGSSQDSDLNLFVELQAELCEIMATTGNPKKYLVQAIKRLSDAFQRRSHLENMEFLISVNEVVSQALVDTSQENLIFILSVLSKQISWLCEDDGLEPFFELNHTLSKTLATQSQARKLDLLFELNRHLSIFMSSDSRDSATFGLINLNQNAFHAIKERLDNPTCLIMTNEALSGQMKSTSDKALLDELIKLNHSLAKIFLLRNMKTKDARLIKWKLQLSNVMQSNAMRECEKANTEKNEEKELSHGIGETSDGKAGLFALPDVLKNTTSGPLVTIPDAEENANELQSQPCSSRQQYRNVQLGGTEELVGERKPQVPIGGKRATGEGVAEVPFGRERFTRAVVAGASANQSGVEGEKQRVVEEAPGISMNLGNASRAKKNFMKRMYLPPIKRNELRR